MDTTNADGDLRQDLARVGELDVDIDVELQCMGDVSGRKRIRFACPESSVLEQHHVLPTRPRISGRKTRADKAASWRSTHEPPSLLGGSAYIIDDGVTRTEYPIAQTVRGAKRQHVLRSKSNGERGWLAKMAVLGFLGIATAQDAVANFSASDEVFEATAVDLVGPLRLLVVAAKPFFAQFWLFGLFWDTLPWWLVMPMYLCVLSMQIAIGWYLFSGASRVIARYATFYAPRYRSSWIVQWGLKFLWPILYVASWYNKTPAKWIYEDVEPVLKDGHWWLPCKEGSCMMRVRPATLQLLASTAPPKSVLEAYMPGSVSIRTTQPPCQGEVQMFDDDKWVSVGECTRVSWTGKWKTSSNYLVFPTHLLVKGRQFQVVHGGKVAPLDAKKIRDSKSGTGCALYSTTNNFDFVVFCMPESFFSTLGMKAAKVGLYQVGAAKVFGRMGKDYVQTTGDLTVATRTHRMNHTASTEPGWSGAPIFQYNTVVGMHQGYNPPTELEHRGCNPPSICTVSLGKHWACHKSHRNRSHHGRFGIISVS